MDIYLSKGSKGVELDLYEVAVYNLPASAWELGLRWILILLGVRGLILFKIPYLCYEYCKDTAIHLFLYQTFLDRCKWLSPCQVSESELAQENPSETQSAVDFYIKLVKSCHQSARRSFKLALLFFSMV